MLVTLSKIETMVAVPSQSTSTALETSAVERRDLPL